MSASKNKTAIRPVILTVPSEGVSGGANGAKATSSSTVVYPLRLPATARNYSKNDLATAAIMFRKLQKGEDLRPDAVTSARKAIAESGYEDALNLEFVMDKVADCLLTDMGYTAAGM